MEDFSYSTVARNKTPLRLEHLKVRYYKQPHFLDNKLNDRLRVVFVPKGAGFLTLDGKTKPFFAPCFFCLNEENRCETSELAEGTKILYFHPSALNKSLNFANIREQGMQVEPAVIENRLLFRAFISEQGQGIISNLGPENALRFENLVDSLYNELEGQETGWWPCRSRSFLTELLFFIARIQDRGGDLGLLKTGTEALCVSPDFKPFLEYFLRSYKKKISLTQVSKEFNTNRTSLNDRFKAETGKSVIAYLIDLRLRIAAALLLDTGLPIVEVAERVGMGDVSHFERLFKKKYERSPKDYRLAAKAAKN